MSTKAGKANNKVEPKFSKEQFLKSKMFMNELDLVMIVLEEDKEYTIKELENAINALKGGK